MTARRWTLPLCVLALSSATAAPLAAQAPAAAPAPVGARTPGPAQATAQAQPQPQAQTPAQPQRSPGAGQPAAALVHLAYVRGPGAESCPAPEALVSAVEARLGRAVFVPSPDADLLAQVTARRHKGQFAIDVQLFDRSRHSLGRRQLRTRARHCSALDDSLALVLSLAADVHRPERRDAAAEPALPATLNTPLEIPPPAVLPRQPLRLRPDIGIAFSAGLQPAVGVGLSARLEIVPPHFWPLSLGATLWKKQEQGEGAGASFGVQMLELGVCPWRFEPLRVELDVCAKQAFGRVRVAGFGFDETQTSQEWLAAFGAGLGARYWFGAGFVSVSGSLLVPVVQRRYFFTDGADVTLYEAPWVFGVGTVAVGFEL